MRLLSAALLTTLPGWAHAHPGHGIAADGHWHATDAWGFLLAGALVALAIWLSRGGK
jgi:hypothetical protein